MKSIRVAEDIVPLGKFKTHASSFLKKLGSDGRPIVITQNGLPAGVLVSPEEFDRLTEERLFVAAVREGLADSESGRVIDDDRLGQDLDERFGAVDG